VTKTIEQYDRALTNGGSMTNLADDVLPEKENEAFRGKVRMRRRRRRRRKRGGEGRQLTSALL